ncbi:amidohydrolase [Burkholderia cenocepacia]|uniref:amidohydrolase family protein n=1 Tax=Burkholderia anthinoferrum TaxID=3090833 RepID=UPI000CE1D483|nr:amidohydrolase family protein [Burkholderia anthinoferrum]RQU68229.1 amidohydrolase [Burkholderia cenocepacia]RQZ85418.1 amidohydrolase [Burkholderia cenocepacia]RRA05958.1 amidohydrolase [Burkholderia cenocepacia]
MAKISKIALEEHFMTPGFEHYSRSFTSLMPDAVARQLAADLGDFDDARLSAMDRAGIELSVLSQTGPAIQGESDRPKAIEMAMVSNDYLAEKVARRPDRYAGFAALPMQSPRDAVSELQRAVTVLGMKGALVNGHSHGTYYDDPAYDVVWSALEQLDVPLYLHPTDAKGGSLAFSGHPELSGAIWGWGVETATHALRLIFGGVFDRFPRLKVILGHMGEGLPFQRWRMDSRFAAYPNGIRLERAPSEYIGTNIVITTAGVCSHAALSGAIAELGADAVMFSVDYPYESSEIAARFIEEAPLNSETLQKVCNGNAKRLLKL